ncbi:hypothetical protein PT273_06260 [Orbaceae bacterium ESL0727]|nr:hypothetical protein [Orbaceae bacterium ESL0727]
MNAKQIIIILSFTIALIVSNGCWLVRIKNIALQQETDKRLQAEEYAKKVEYQRELTKSSIQTVTEETNLYMQLNEQLEAEKNALQNSIDNLLHDDECANSDIPDIVRKRMFAAPH